MKKILLIIFCLQNVVFAASDIYKQNEQIENLTKDMYEPNIFSMLFGLAVVIGLIYLTSYIYQKLVKIKLNNDVDEEINKMQIVNSLSLGQQKSLHIVKFNDEYSMISVCQNNINFLKNVNYIETDENDCDLEGRN